MNNPRVTSTREPLRFPVRAPHFPPDEPLIQVEVDKGVTDLVSSADLIKAFEHGAASVTHDPALQILMTELFLALQKLGAVSIESAFGPAPAGLDQVLTAEEKAERARIYSVTFNPAQRLSQVARQIRALKTVTRAVPVPGYAPPHLPDDPLLGTNDQDTSKQWYLFRCHGPQSWDLATGRGVVIADVDWGCRITHQDLTNIEPAKAYNSYNGSGDVGHGKHVSHGTSVLGIAGAVVNHLGIVGFAPHAALWPIQAVTGRIDKKIPGASWARGIDYVLASRDPRRKVVMIENQSSRGRNIEQEIALNVAIKNGIAHGLVMVVAAGNGSHDVSLDDGNHKIPKTGSILVGSTDFHPHLNLRACSSNFGDRLTVSAPGDFKHDVTCTNKSDSAYRTGFGGTSGATPKVGGVCAQMLEADPTLTHADVKAILEMTGGSVVANPEKPAGVFLNAYAAVRMAYYQSNRMRSAAAEAGR